MIVSADLVCSILREGRSTWPRVAVSDASLMDHLSRLKRIDTPLACPADLYLACALTNGVRDAHQEFERTIIPKVRRELLRRETPAQADEVLQVLREQIFVADTGSVPRIAEYQGRGALASWIRASAVRIATKLRRNREIPTPDDEVGAKLVGTGRFEVELLRNKYWDSIHSALQQSLAELPRRDRTVVRLHFLDGLVLEEIAVLYRVNRSSVCRWIAQSRRVLLDRTRQRLADHGLGEPEIKDLMRQFASSLDLSLERILETSNEHSR